MHSITVLIVAGGFLKLCTSLMSAGLIVSRAARAAFSTGIASARSASHSVLMALAAAPFFSASATSASTMAALGSTTSVFSLATLASSSSVSATVLIRLGFRAVSSSCIAETWSAVLPSFSRPIS